jgi:hypothetical protein
MKSNAATPQKTAENGQKTARCRQQTGIVF